MVPPCTPPLPVQTGKLIAGNVGREKVVGSDGKLKDGSKSILVPIASVFGLALLH